MKGRIGEEKRNEDEKKPITPNFTAALTALSFFFFMIIPHPPFFLLVISKGLNFHFST